MTNNILDKKTYKTVDKLCMTFFLLYMITYNIFSYRSGLVIISEIVLIILLGLIGVYILFKRKFSIGILGILLSIYIGWSSITCYWAISQTVALGKLKTIIQLSIVAVLLYNYFDTKEKIQKAIKCITISYIILGIYTVYIYGLGNLLLGSIGTRIGSQISQENVLGMALATGSILCFYHGFYLEDKTYYIGTLFLFIMSSFTGSRKALLIIVVGIIFLTFMKHRTKKMVQTILLLLLSVGVIYFILKLPMFELVLERFEGVKKGAVMEASAIVRGNMIKDGWLFFKEKPFFGYGLDCFRFLGYGTYSHNNYIELLINGGVVTFTLYYIIHIYGIIKLYILTHKFDKSAIIFITMMLIDLFMDFADVSYDSKIIFINLAIYFSYIRIKDSK